MIPDSPTVEHLMGVYLNYDWPDEYGDVWRAVGAFVAREQPESTSDLLEEVASLLNSDASEHELKRFFVDELHGGYLPSGDGITFREWLTELSERLPGT